MQSKAYEKIELLREPTSGIIIKVKDPILEGGGSFTSYLIAGSDKLGTFEGRRRFNEFFLLREGLIKSWPGLYVPPISQKKMTGNKEDKFIEERRRFLEYFCQQVAKTPYLYYSEVFQQFIRNKSVQLESMNEQIQRLPTSQRLILFKQLFGDTLTGKQPINELKSRISHFNIYLKKSEKELDGLKQRARDIAYAVRAFNNNFNICSTLILPEYQKNVFKEYVDEDMKQLPFLHDNMLNQRVRLYRDQAQNPLDYIVDFLVFEYRETIAFQQAIQIKQELETKKRKLEQKRISEQSELSKLMSGKTTFKSIFTRGSKNQQISVLEKQVADDAKEIESLDALLNVVTVVLSREITKYKDDKQVQYLNLLSKVATVEIQKLGVYGDLMRTLAVARQAIKVQE